MLVTEQEVRGEEDVSVMLWDSDKRSADDLVGRVNVGVGELMRNVSLLLLFMHTIATGRANR